MIHKASLRSPVPAAIQTARTLFRNTAALGLAQLSKSVLSIVYVAALARHLQAEGMGELATAQSLAAVAALFVSLGFNILAVREVAQDRSRSSAWLSNLLAMRSILSVGALAALVLFSRLAGYQEETQTVVVVYGVVMMLGALVLAAQSVFQACERLEVDAAVQLGRDGLNVALSLVAIELDASLLVLVWISALASSAQLVVQLLLLRYLRLARLIRPSLRACWEMSSRGVSLSLVVLISVFYAQVGLILVSLMNDTAATGAYSAATNLLTVLLILPDVYSRAVLPVFSRLTAGDVGAVAAHYLGSTKILNAIGLPLAVGTVLIADPLVRWLYGPGFESAVLVLRVLAIALFAISTYASGTLLIAIGHQRMFVVCFAVELATQIGLSLVLIPAWGPVGAGLGYAVPRVAGAVFYAVVCHRVLKLPLPFWTLLRTAGATALMGLAVYTGLQLGVHFLWLACLVGPLAYLVGLYLVGVPHSEEWRLLRGVAQFGG